jgi:3-oxoacyl-[acyl-carrier-protein] synthase III
MKFRNVVIDSFGYELPPNVITSAELEARLSPLYNKLHFQHGQLETMTGIYERRWWDSGFSVREGAVMAGKKALKASFETSGISPADIGMLIYGGVCRENLEPATACGVSHGLGLGPDTMIYDVSNACLGIINGMVQVASAIELGQIRAGMVVSCESAREIVTATIDRLLEAADMETFKKCIATLTGGSGAVAVILARKDLSMSGHRLLGGAARSAAEHYKLCTWGPDTGIPATMPLVMETDSVGVLKNGVTLGIETFKVFRQNLGWDESLPEKIICHQVGATHQKNILAAVGISEEKDFTTFPYLGNIGTVSLPITAAIAEERDFFSSGDSVGFLGIGSGLNCLMLGVKW